jgi:hypothetical protein
VTDNLEEVRERVRRARSHLEAVWPRRLTESEEARKAVDELNDDTTALGDDSTGQTAEVTSSERCFASRFVGPS